MKRSLTLLPKISLAAIIPALIVPLLGSIFYFVILPGTALAQVVYGATKVFTIVYPLCFFGWKQLFTQRASVSGRSMVTWGLASGIVISLLGFALMETPLGHQVRAGAGAVQVRAAQLGFAQNFLLFAVFISIFHSALEEYYWRGFVFGQLRNRLGKVGSHSIAALAFAAHHLVVTWQFFPPALAIFLALCVALGGLIWTLLYERQGSLLGIWLSHLCVDVFLMIIGYQLLFGA